MITSYTGISGSRTAYLIASIEGSNTVLIVVSSGQTAERLRRDLSFCAPDAEILVIPEEDDVQILYEARNRESQVIRVKALQTLAAGASGRSGGRCFVIAPVSAAVRMTEEPERFVSGMISVGAEIPGA